MKVGDLMTTEVITIGPDAPLKEAAMVMVRVGISGLPVVDDGRRVVGIITEADFVTTEANRSWGRQRKRLLANVFSADTPPDAAIVSDVMTTRLHTIDRGSTVTEAARMMTDLGVKRLPVVLPDGTLDGIISRADVMGAFARSDEELRSEIEREVVLDVMQLHDSHVVVTVEDGQVTLSGDVPRRSEARLLEELVARIEGVVSVSTELRWATDDSGIRM